MANGYFERGEIYWVRMDGGVGSEMGSFRPAVIVSNNRGNKTSSIVNMCFLSTRDHDISIDVETYATGRQTWIKANSVTTIDKSRLKPQVSGVLSTAEMRKVEDALEEVLDLGYADTAAMVEKENEIARLKEELDSLTQKVTLERELYAKDLNAVRKSAEEEELSYKVEIAMWQKMYDRSLDTLVRMKLAQDVYAREDRLLKPEPVVVKEPVVEDSPISEPVSEPVKEPESPVEPERLDINTATRTALEKIGFPVSLAKAVIKARPYDSVEDLKKVPGMSKTKYRILEPKVFCKPVIVVEEPVVETPVVEEPVEAEETVVPPVGGKVNVNKVGNITELMKMTGMCQRTASEIIRHRDKFGDYEKVDDLLNLKSFGKIAMGRYGHILEV